MDHITAQPVFAQCLGRADVDTMSQFSAEAGTCRWFVFEVSQTEPCLTDFVYSNTFTYSRLMVKTISSFSFYSPA